MILGEGEKPLPVKQLDRMAGGTVVIPDIGSQDLGWPTGGEASESKPFRPSRRYTSLA